VIDMWPFSIFKRRDPRQNHVTDQDDSDSGAATMATKGELNRMKLQLQMEKAKLEHARDVLRIQADIKEAQLDLQDLDEEDSPEGSGEGSADAELVKLLAGFVASKNAGSSPQVQPTTSIEATPEGEPTNEELRDLWHKLPDNYKTQALGMIKK
jgi:hypothetical protein